MNNFVTISGCSGGGKSTLIAELASRGHRIVQEPGRRIVREAVTMGAADTLPWNDMAAFARRAIALSLADRDAMRGGSGWVFFDRGLVDACAALDAATGSDETARLGSLHRSHPIVFMAPPWPEIYRSDAERPHAFDMAVAEYERLTRAYSGLGYRLVVLPKRSVAERADHLLSTLARG